MIGGRSSSGTGLRAGGGLRSRRGLRAATGLGLGGGDLPPRGQLGRGRDVVRAEVDPELHGPEGDPVLRQQRGPADLLPLDLGPVGGREVADHQQAVGLDQDAMPLREARVVDLDVAELATAQERHVLRDRYRRPPVGRDQLGFHLDPRVATRFPHPSYLTPSIVGPKTRAHKAIGCMQARRGFGGREGSRPKASSRRTPTRTRRQAGGEPTGDARILVSAGSARARVPIGSPTGEPASRKSERVRAFVVHHSYK